MPPSGAQKDYCRYKVNGKKCPDAHDQTNRSHNQGRIQWWIKNQKDKPCKAQRPCLNFEGGLCLFSHPPDEVKWQDERQQLMSRDTELLEVLDLPPVLQSGGTTSEGDCLGVRDCTQLCTFSTIDECNIAIPGEPRRLMPSSKREVMTRTHLRNRPKCYPIYEHTYQPLFKSLKLARPDMSSLKEVDLVLDASDLCKILQHMSGPKDTTTERFDMEWRDGRLYMVGWEADPRHEVPFDLTEGFLSLNSRYASGLEDSISHHLALTYNLGGLKCLVQTEADACWWDHSIPVGGSNSDVAPGNQPGTALGGSHPSLSQVGNGTAPSSGTLKIRHSGQEIPRTCLMEVKIHMRVQRLRFESHAYFSQITQVYDGLIRDGILLDRVSRGRCRNTELELGTWEQENQKNLHRMVEFLKMLIEKARSSPARRLALVLKCAGEQENDEATLYARSDERSLVPDDMVLPLKE